MSGKPNTHAGVRRYRKKTRAHLELEGPEKDWWERRLREARGSVRLCAKHLNLCRTSVHRHLRRVGITKERQDEIWAEHHTLRGPGQAEPELRCVLRWGPKDQHHRWKYQRIFEGLGGWEHNALHAIASMRNWRPLVDQPMAVTLWDGSNVQGLILRLGPKGLYFEKDKPRVTKRGRKST